MSFVGYKPKSGGYRNMTGPSPIPDIKTSLLDGRF